MADLPNGMTFDAAKEFVERFTMEQGKDPSFLGHMLII